MAADACFLWVYTEFCHGAVPLAAVFKVLTVLGQVKSMLEISNLPHELDICACLSWRSSMNYTLPTDYGTMLRTSAYGNLTRTSRIVRFVSIK
jgi:hypothetical protein